MAKYSVTMHFDLSEIYEVEADSPEEASELVHAGGYDPRNYSQDLANVEVEEIEE